MLLISDVKNVPVEVCSQCGERFYSAKISKKLDNLISAEKEQVIEVEFDFKIEEEFIAKIPHLQSYKNIHDMVWELTFLSDKDMRPAVFDFASDNGLKTLQLNQKNKNLETLFREMTKNK